MDRDAALTATGAIAVSRARAAASLKLKAAKGQATAGRATTLNLKLTAGDLRKLRAAVRAKRSATAKVAVRVTPTTGSATTTKTNVRQKAR